MLCALGAFFFFIIAVITFGAMLLTFVAPAAILANIYAIGTAEAVSAKRVLIALIAFMTFGAMIAFRFCAVNTDCLETVFITWLNVHIKIATVAKSTV